MGKGERLDAPYAVLGVQCPYDAYGTVQGRGLAGKQDCIPIFERCYIYIRYSGSERFCYVTGLYMAKRDHLDSQGFTRSYAAVALYDGVVQCRSGTGRQYL